MDKECVLHDNIKKLVEGTDEELKQEVVKEMREFIAEKQDFHQDVFKPRRLGRIADKWLKLINEQRRN